MFDNTRRFRSLIKDIGLDAIDGGSPIIPIMLYDERTAQEMAARMLDCGVYVVAFSYPVVPKGRARIRTQVSAALSFEDLEKAAEAFKKVKHDMGI